VDDYGLLCKVTGSVYSLLNRYVLSILQSILKLRTYNNIVCICEIEIMEFMYNYLWVCGTFITFAYERGGGDLSIYTKTP